jgi:ABC-2 type transport system permease protein
MDLGRINAIIWRQAYELRRNPNHLTNMVYWPIVNISVWGFLTLYLAHDNQVQPSLLKALLGAAILWGLFNGFQRDMALGFLEELWSRNLVNLFASPLTIYEYISALIVVNVLKTFVSVGVMAMVTMLCYHYNIGPDLTGLVPFMLVLGIAALALGIVVTGLILRYTTKVQGFAWSIAGVLMPLSCVFYPLHSLSPGLQLLAGVLPTTHAFEGMRQVMTSGTLSRLQLAWGLGLDVAYLLAAAWCFHALFAAAKRQGLLVKTG